MSSLTEDILMEAEAGIDESIRYAFQSHIDSLDTVPAWWKDFKSEAYESFENLPLPKRSDENWRFASIGNLDLGRYDFAQKSASERNTSLAEKSSFTATQAGAFVFVDNQTVHAKLASDELREKGVIWCPLSEAVQNHGDLLKDYFMKQAINLGSEKFAHLHSAFVSNGALLYVPKGVEIDDPFCVYNWSATEKGTLFPHTLVIAEENAKANVIEVHLSDGEHAALSCGVSHLFAGVGSRLNYTLIQNLNQNTLGFQINSNIAGKDSEVNMNSIILGCSHYRSETHGQIKGSGAHVDMRSMTLSDGDQEIDQRTLQTHSAPHTTSNLLFKNALKGDSKTIFSGLIKVDETAQQTDAYQTNRNLLLSTTAEANSLPGLEIEANDVKCSHGATTSEIEDEEIFYMLTRGIPKDSAEELIVYGFFEEVLERVDDESLSEQTRRLIRNKFRA